MKKSKISLLVFSKLKTRHFHRKFIETVSRILYGSLAKNRISQKWEETCDRNKGLQSIDVRDRDT